MDSELPIRLTQFSHGAGCGCKISPKVLASILGNQTDGNIVGEHHSSQLWVGNHTADDAAVFGISDEQGIISTTDFFMPIVDDPFEFGQIAATNAISDIYAMGGTPIMAIAILGWPLDKLPPHIAGKVMDGGRKACLDAGIVLAGGHSIDAPEPIFGLAVTGTVTKSNLKQNSTAKEGDRLLLTKPIGIGILTTAEKRAKLKKEHESTAKDAMIQLNKFGAKISHLSGIHAMTDVTGFGLLGHLSEMAEGSQLTAQLLADQVPLLPGVKEYIALDCIPGGTHRNYESYGHKIKPLSEKNKKDYMALFCDPQTSGGLLIAVAPDTLESVKALAAQHQQLLVEIGSFSPLKTFFIEVIE